MNKFHTNENALNMVSETNSGSEEFAIKTRVQSNLIFSLSNRDNWKSLVQVSVFLIAIFSISIACAFAGKFITIPSWIYGVVSKEAWVFIGWSFYGLLLSVGALSLLFTLRERGIRMFISDKGVESPWTNLPAPGCGFKFDWSEIVSIRLVDSYARNVKGHSIEFVSNNGKALAFQVMRLDDDDFNHLYEALEKWANPESLDDDLLNDLKKWYEFESAKLESYAVLKDGFHYLSNQYSLASYQIRQKEFQFREAPYRVVDVLSAGGISATYLVENSNGEMRCLKEYWLDWNEEKDLLIDKLSSHLKKIQEYDVSGMVRVHQYFEQDNRFYISTDNYQGRILRDYVSDRTKKLPVSRMKSIMKQLRDILDKFASLDTPIVHGGINPDSIAITKTGYVTLIEPPLVNTILATELGDIFSGFSYAAPELLQGKVTPLADAYSFGRILFFLLHKRDPESRINLSLKDQEKPFRQIILKTGSVDPNDRMNVFDAAEAIERLEDKKKLSLLSRNRGESK